MPKRLDRILVCGPTGSIGAATLSVLSGAGRDPIALVPSVMQASTLPSGADWRVGKLSPTTVPGAFDGIDAVLLSSAGSPNLAHGQLTAINAALRAGVRRIVKISTSPAFAFHGTPGLAAAQHVAVEDALKMAPIERVIIRPN